MKAQWPSGRDEQACQILLPGRVLDRPGGLTMKIRWAGILYWPDLEPGETVYGPADGNPDHVFVIRNGQCYLVMTGK